MTTVVGVLCRDGVVIGTDSAATFVQGEQQRTIEQPTDKLDLIGNVVVAGSGAVGFGQRFCEIVRGGWANDLFRKPPLEVGKNLSSAFLADLRQTQCGPGGYLALVAFPAEKRPMLCEFDAQFQPELKTNKLWYASIGSAQTITDPFLGLMREVFWEDGPPPVQDGIFAVAWTIQQAIQLNPGGVNEPIRIAVLEPRSKGQLKARVLSDDELDEHRQQIRAATEHLRDFRMKQQADAPEPPTA